MNKQTKSQGFSVIEALIIFAVVAVLGLAGWFIWQKNHKNEPARQTSNTPSQNSNKQSKPAQQKSPSDPTEGGKYLIIQEWGVRFPLPEELRGDVEYGIFTFNSGDQTTYFTSKKLASRSEEMTCKLTARADSSGQGIFGGTIAVSRSKTEPEESSGRSFHSSGYWYTTEASNGGACYQEDTGIDRGEFNSMMLQAIRQVEPITK